MYKIGITGHRDILASKRAELKNSLGFELQKIIDSTDGEIIMYNSLAIGADCLAAELAIEMGIKLVAVLPFPKDEYEKDFSEEDMQIFRKQLEYAEKIVVTSDGCCENKDAGYRVAGIYVADNSDKVFAFWNGTPGTDYGCGTSDIVKYIKDKFSQKLCVIDAMRVSDADNLALKNQKSYINSLRVMALIGVAMICAFLFYDELYISCMLFIYLGLFALGGIVMWQANKKQFHENYIFYRMLAEACRVQDVLDKSGVKKLASDYYPHTMQDVKESIENELRAKVRLMETDNIDVLKSEWIEDQYNYHNRAIAKVSKKIKANKTISTIILVVTVALIIGACIVEVTNLPYRTCLIVVVGLFSAGSLFLSSYYGKQNLNRQYEDHVHMADLYKYALDEIGEEHLSKEMVAFIAREEILENSNWYSYTKESTLSLDY